jgi:hypothetical protein
VRLVTVAPSSIVEVKAGTFFHYLKKCVISRIRKGLHKLELGPGCTIFSPIKGEQPAGDKEDAMAGAGSYTG